MALIGQTRYYEDIDSSKVKARNRTGCGGVYWKISLYGWGGGWGWADDDTRCAEDSAGER